MCIPRSYCLFNHPIPLEIAIYCNHNVRLLYDQSPLDNMVLMFWAFYIPADLSLRFFGGIRLGRIRYFRVFLVINSLEWNKFVKLIVLVITAILVRIMALNFILLTVTGKEGLSFYQVFSLSNEITFNLIISILVIAICFSLDYGLSHLKNKIVSNSKYTIVYNYLHIIVYVLNKTILALSIFRILLFILYLYTHSIPENIIDICDNAIIRMKNQ